METICAGIIAVTAFVVGAYSPAIGAEIIKALDALADWAKRR